MNSLNVISMDQACSRLGINGVPVSVIVATVAMNLTRDRVNRLISSRNCMAVRNALQERLNAKGDNVLVSLYMGEDGYYHDYPVSIDAAAVRKPLRP